MADEQKVQSHLLRLGRGCNGFFCPESRFHLMGGAKPQAYWPAAAPLTSAVKVALRAGTLHDVNRTIKIEDVLSNAQLAKRDALIAKKAKATAAAVDDDFIMDDEDKTPDTGNTNEGNKEEDDDNKDGNAPDGDKLTEEQIDASKKKDLLAFITKHELSLDDLGLDAKSKEDEVKHALKIHFGYKMV